MKHCNSAITILTRENIGPLGVAALNKLVNHLSSFLAHNSLRTLGE